MTSPQQTSNYEQARSLLIVDDEPNYADSLGNLLVAEGYGVKKANDLGTAKKILRDNSFDLALIDIQLGDNNGVDFIADCLHIQPELACILITGYASVETATEAFRAGAHDFLQKTIDIEDLLIALERCYQRIKLIQEKKDTEVKLAESNERFRSSFEYASIGMVLADQEGEISQVNEAACGILGYSELELIRLNFTDITHPDDIDEVISNRHKVNSGKIDTWRMTIRYRHSNGHYIWADINVSRVDKTEKNSAYNIVHIVDVSNEKMYSEELTYLASHDSLTKLINRREFENRFQRILDTSTGEFTEQVLCFIDLDQFKVVNDTGGHAAGDEMLRQLAQLMKNKIRSRDTIARLGGDEFGIIMEHCSITNALRAANSLLDSIRQFQFQWDHHKFTAGASIGLVSIHKGDSGPELLKAADAACYKAKDLGRNRVCVYEMGSADLVRHQEEITWISHINAALDEKRLVLYAQIIEPLSKVGGLHYEILLRYIDGSGKVFAPGAFLPTAERYNLITTIDRYVVEMAFGELAKYPGFCKSIDFISINLSGQSLANPEFLNFVISLFADSGVDGNKICFEITETAAISNMSMAIEFISNLKGLGCRFALDDFGSGLSSFGYLKKLPVDYLKIDGVFVQDMVNDPIDRAMVKSINEIGQVMGMLTIAEYVENDEIKGMLREIGVDYAQGYGIGMPQAFNELLDRDNNVTVLEPAKRSGKAP
jgi:diguanylate cyclase (GGDEF)-like protein/PAS domain S-box-containing protein